VNWNATLTMRTRTRVFLPGLATRVLERIEQEIASNAKTLEPYVAIELAS
jgi:hypothetical protein